VGVLSDFEPLDFGGVRPNHMDAAIAKIDPGIVRTHAIGGGIGIIGGVDSTPAANIAVKKYGKTTGLTVADLIFQGVSVTLPYASGNALFVNQYGIVDGAGAMFAGPGDSGALVVNSGNEGVGLLFCVASMGNVALASPLDPILTRFGIHF
jgi:hypothetical protein